MKRKNFFATAALIVVVAPFIGMMFGVESFNHKTDKRVNYLIVPAEERVIVYDSTYFMVCGQDTIEVEMQVDTTVCSIERDPLKGDYFLVDDINTQGLIIKRDTLWVVEKKPSSIDEQGYSGMVFSEPVKVDHKTSKAYLTYKELREGVVVKQDTLWSDIKW